jgi:aconitate hydratase
VSAKDVILELLRRHDVKGGVGFVIEYYGEGLQQLSAWDRHVIANMGAELGATTTVFPSDNLTREALAKEEREGDWVELKADDGASYDAHDEVVLDELVPLIAKPTSPGNVVPVREVEGLKIHQSMIGSSANPGLRDFWIVGEIVKDKSIPPDVSLDINPSSRENIQNMTAMGTVANLIQAGARFHQSGCMGCIGMGQAPAYGKISLRTVPRNFPGRSGTLDDRVYLCSPETAAASALTGVITDPRDMKQKYNLSYPKYAEPENKVINRLMLVPPDGDSEKVELVKGKNIKSIPQFNQLEDELEVPVILKMENNISTDEILKAGADVLPLRSNIPEISKYAFYVVDQNFHDKAREVQEKHGGHMVVAGENYAQGSSREHAALAPKFLGQKAVIAKSYARIGWQNLVNFGIIPFEFVNPSDYDSIEATDVLKTSGIRDAIMEGRDMEVINTTKNKTIKVKTSLSERQKHIVLYGGLINLLKEKISKS